MRRLLFVDPMTGRKSLTVSMLFWSFILYLVTVGCYIAGRGDLKICLIALFAVGIFYAGYRQKRIKINFQGIEFEHDKEACHVADTDRPQSDR